MNSSISGLAPSAPSYYVLLEELADAIESGDESRVEALATHHPEHAEELVRMLPTLRALVGISGGLAPRSSPEGVGPKQQLGDFYIEGEIGRGGMGIVYQAKQVSVGRTVALKVLPFAVLAGEKSLQRFQNEVRAAALLDHPHIVPVYAVGEDCGVHYYAMKLVRGQSLSTLIAQMCQASDVVRPRESSADKPPTDFRGNADADSTQRSLVGLTARSNTSSKHYQEVARVGIQAADALQHAHEQGVIHRDVKPANLLVDISGGVMIADFGLATIENDVHLTKTGELVGTLRYMSPEQALGKREEQDHRTDIYSLAATLYELLTLKPVVVGDDPRELLKQIAHGELRSPREHDPGIPMDLATILLKGLEQSPLDRYATAQDLADDLRCFLQHQPIKAKPSSIVHRMTKWSRRHVGIVWTATAGAMLLACLSAVGAALLAESRNVAYEQREIANSAARRAKAEAAVAQAVQDFINLDLLGHQELRVRSDKLLLRDAVDRAANSVGARFAGQSLVEAGIRETLGQTYLGLREFPKAISQFRQSRELRLAELGETHAATGAVTQKLATALIDYGQSAEAGRLLATLYDQQLRELGPEHPATLQSTYAIGIMASREGDWERAEKLLRQVVAGYMDRHGEHASETLRAQRGLASALAAAGRSDEAVAVARRVRSVAVARHGGEHSETIDAAIHLCDILTATGDEESIEAYETLMAILPVAGRLYGERHSQIHAAKRIAIEAAARRGWATKSEELRKAYRLDLRCFLAAAGEWHLAAKAHEQHVKRYHTPKEGLGWSEEWMRPAALYVMAIREQGLSTEPFERYCHAMIDHFASTEFAGDAERTLKTCLIYDLGIPLDRIRIDLIEQVLETNEAGYWERPNYEVALALYRYRIDDLVMAEAWLEMCRSDLKQLNHSLPDIVTALSLAVESLLHSRLGHPAQARNALDEAERSLVPMVTFDAEGRVATGGVFNQRVAIDSLMIVALMDEARTKLAELEASATNPSLAPGSTGATSPAQASR